MKRGAYYLPQRIMREQRATVRALLEQFRDACDTRTRYEALNAYDAWADYSRQILPAICEAVRLSNSNCESHAKQCVGHSTPEHK